MATKTKTPSWSDVKTQLLDFDRAGLLGLLQDLYAANKDNQAFFHLKFNTSGMQVVDFIGNRCPIADYKAGLDRFSGVGSANSKAANSDF